MLKAHLTLGLFVFATAGIPLAAQVPAGMKAGGAVSPAADTYSLSYSPGSLTFPPVPAGVSSAEQIVKITNAGTAGAVFSDYLIPKTYTIDYNPPTSVVAGCNPKTDNGVNLQAGESCAIGITYNAVANPPAPDNVIGNNFAIDLCPPCQFVLYKLPLNSTTGSGPVLKYSPNILKLSLIHI